MKTLEPNRISISNYVQPKIRNDRSIEGGIQNDSSIYKSILKTDVNSRWEIKRPDMEKFEVYHQFKTSSDEPSRKDQSFIEFSKTQNVYDRSKKSPNFDKSFYHHGN